MAFQELDPYGEEYELHWLTTVLVFLFGLLLLQIPVLMGLDKKLGYDMMQHAVEEDASLSDLKDGVRNIWQQISTVAALIFPSTIAMLQEGGEVKPFYYESSAATDEDGSGEPVVVHLQQAYLASTLFALMTSGFGCSYCLLNFAYIECLSPRQAAAFFLSQPASVGGPLISLCQAFQFLWISGAIWMFGTFGTAVGILAMSGIPIYWWGVYRTFRINSEFDPSECASDVPKPMLSNGCVLHSGKMDRIHKGLYAKLQRELVAQNPEAETASDVALPSQSAGTAASKCKDAKVQSSRQVAPCEDPN